jgi:single-stranded-DNA-specific exonuclease
LKHRWLARPVPGLHLKTPPEEFSHLPVSVALLLARRGLDGNGLHSLVNPSLENLSPWNVIPGIERACERIASAIDSGERILVHGDYDADGITATTLTCIALRRLGGKVSYHIPDRFGDGYGIGDSGIEACSSAGADLMVTVDCGITAVAEINELSSRGIDTVVTDHHRPSSELPEAFSLVNPQLSSDSAPWSGLSGAGVAFRTMQALFERYGSGIEDIVDLLPLAAIGTICDVVPLTDDNRILVSIGLQVMSRCTIPGLTAIAVSAGNDLKKISSRDIAFSIGPRLNSSGRIGHASSAVELLLAESDARVAELAEVIEKYNSERRSLDGAVYEDALRMSRSYSEASSLVLCSSKWHQGVIGIAASRLVSDVGVPVVLVSIMGDRAKGSARSTPGVSIHDVLSEISADTGMLDSFGGHHMAAGLSIATDRIDSFRDELEQRVGALLERTGRGTVIWLDGQLEECDFNIDTVRAVEMLEPFGQGNEEPVWLTRGAHAISWKSVGHGRHLSCLFQIGDSRIRAIGFGMAGYQSMLPHPVDLAFTLREDNWRSNGSVQLHLRGIRPAGAI